MMYIISIPTCECGREKQCVLLEPNNEVWECIVCDRPQEEIIVYKNVCWNCKHPIDSRFCAKSITPGMGYHCNNCGEDLTKWKAIRLNYRLASAK